jgi:hypothetical protein
MTHETTPKANKIKEAIYHYFLLFGAIIQMKAGLVNNTIIKRLDYAEKNSGLPGWI